MLSLILYGRNDSYGYNLHKRAAISLNCMAEVLTAPDDEIIFVDYNTPDDFPTFPEAIQDTLTARAKGLLRILRVRPAQHERFRDRTHLVALEPIARNVALRRSNPANRWILSTNTDMVFVPQRGASLSEIVADLSDAYYPLPRFEVPETLWESADRLDPKATIEAFGAWGRAFHLNEIVLSAEEAVMFDAPGDFQLALRADLWKMDGFHESMLLGWHVDSNLAKRLSLLPRLGGELLDDVLGFHCDHTRQVTPAHRAGAAENSLQEFYADVTSPQLPEQTESWGLAGENIEEISISTTSRLYLEALQAAIPVPLSGITPRITYAYEHYNRIDYSADHVLPFLTDAVAGYPRDTILGWFGSKRTLLERFAFAWRAMGFSKGIMVWSGARWLGSELPAGCVSASIESVIALCDIFILDWGRRDDVRMEDWKFDSDEAARGVARALRHAVREERSRLATARADPRRFIGVNAVCNDAEWLFHELVGAARTPLATRIRQGYVNDLRREREMLGMLNAGDAGRKISGDIASRPGVAGYLFYVAHLLLDSGNYRFSLEFEANAGNAATGFSGLGFEVSANSCLLRDQVITTTELLTGSWSIDFLVPLGYDTADDWPETELRMRTIGRADIRIRRAVLEKLARSDEGLPALEFNFLPLLSAGGAGTFGSPPPPALHGGTPRALAINATPGVSDFLAYGPHVWLLPGRYEAAYEFWAPANTEQRGIEAAVEVSSAFGNNLFAEQFIDFSERGSVLNGPWQCVRGVLAFDIRTKAPPTAEGLLEFRVWSEGAELSFAALDVRRVGDPGPEQEHVERLFGGRLGYTREAIARRVRLAYDENLPTQDVLWLAKVGAAGKRTGRAIEAVPDIVGDVTYGPYLWFLPGRYEVTFELYVDAGETGLGDVYLEVVREQGNRVIASRLIDVTLGGRLFERPRAGRNNVQRYALNFDISTDLPPIERGLLEFRVWSSGTVAFALNSLLVRQIDPSTVPSDEAEDQRVELLFGGRVDPIREAVARRVQQTYVEHSKEPNVLGLMLAGSAGRRIPHAIEAVAGQATVLAHGPYIWLLPGHYEATFELDAERGDPTSGIRLEVVTHLGTRVLAERGVQPHWRGRRGERHFGRRKGKARYNLPFEITTEAPQAEDGLLEFRVWAPGTIAFKLTAVFVRRVDAPNPGPEKP